MTPTHLADAGIASVAALLAEPARAAILVALSDGRALPAGELARASRVAPPTASAHLARLVDAGVLAVEREGRHRYYRLTDPETVVTALEALALVVPPPQPVDGVRGAFAASAVRRARTCYNHLAGVLGVRIATALVEREWLVLSDRLYEVTPAGESGLEALGVRVAAARRTRRVFARACLDWSERRYHLAGALGAALTARLFELGWIERMPASRAVRVSNAGRRALRRQLGVEVY